MMIEAGSNENGKIQTEIFSEEQTAADYLKILGYQ